MLGFPQNESGAFFFSHNLSSVFKQYRQTVIPNVAGTVFGKVGKYNQYLKVYQIPYGKLFGVRFSDDPPTHGNTP